MSTMTRAFGSSVLMLTLGLIPQPIIPAMISDAIADSFNVKPGAWEITHTGQATGTLLPPDVLGKMPPEQRAKFEQSMQAQAGKPNICVVKSCMTKEDLDQNRIIKEEEDEPGCITKVVTKSSSKLVLEWTGPAPHASTSRMPMEAKTPETIAASIDMERAGSGKVHIDFKGRWLGASCAGIKDGD